jgi:hypothetical protein
MTENLDVENLVRRALADYLVRQEVADAAQRATEQQEKDARARAWRDAVAPVIVACGVRRFCLESLIVEAAEIFELRDGRVVPKPGVLHPRDPCAALDPVTWLADLRAGPEGKMLFGG